MKPLKLAMAQCSMQEEMNQNLAKSLDFCSKAAGCDLLFFQRSSFRPSSRSTKTGMLGRTV